MNSRTILLSRLKKAIAKQKTEPKEMEDDTAWPSGGRIIKKCQTMACREKAAL